MMATIKLTAKDLRLIRSALDHAIVERESFADAYNNQGPEGCGALKLVEQFEALHVKLFGTPSGPAQDKAVYAAMERVPLNKLVEAQSVPSSR